MKRRLLNIALFLLAGAVVNVTVAWGCWFGSDGSLRNKLPFPNMPNATALKIAHDLGFAPQISTPIVLADGMTIRSGFKTTPDVILISQFETVEWPYAEVVSDLPLETASFSYVTAKRVQAGWPTHTMRGMRSLWRTTRLVERGHNTDGGSPVGKEGRRSHCYPCGPASPSTRCSTPSFCGW